MVADTIISIVNERAKQHMQKYTHELVARLAQAGMSHDDAAQLIGNPEPFLVAAGDFEKKRRSRSSIPYYERCSGRKADSEQCTRRRQDGSLFCGTHVKGTPYGRVSDGHAASDKVVVQALEIQGIVHWVDSANNVYSQEDVHARKKNPRVIAKVSIVGGKHVLV